MKLNVDFAQCIEVIEFEPFLGGNVKKYQKGFEKWYYKFTKDDNGIGGCYEARDELKGIVFDAHLIVGWMNEVAPGCNARVIEENIIPGKENKSLQYMYF